MRIERVLANNPGPFTGPGTNTWLLDDGHGNVTVIDPGPIDSAHRDAILDRLAERTPVSVIVTHTHPDHAPMANPLAAALGVPALGHRPGPWFDPDEVLADGDTHDVGSLRVRVVHTPGHADDHLCFRAGEVLFSGDHIIGGSSVMVDDLGAYLRSLEKIQGIGLTRLCPGHGEEMDRPDSVIDWYLAHRLQRHEEIYKAVLEGADTPQEVVSIVYEEIDSRLHPMAERSVRAHLVLLAEEGRLALDSDGLVAIPPSTA
jgi:glyoxylase-like metal-dependent hydrolase (beta-lactamase superfamily II)